MGDGEHLIATNAKAEDRVCVFADLACHNDSAIIKLVGDLMSWQGLAVLD
jgi:hypothetical protein